MHTRGVITQSANVAVRTHCDGGVAAPTCVCLQVCEYLGMPLNSSTVGNFADGEVSIKVPPRAERTGRGGGCCVQAFCLQPLHPSLYRRRAFDTSVILADEV